jgi:hypothetical protein
MKQVLFVVVASLLAAPASADPTKDDLKTFKEYLEKTHKDKKWGSGPARLDSKEIRKAYPDRRFYYVFSSPPLPPGAPLPELIERHRRAMADFQKNYISVTVSLDKDGVRPLTAGVEDLARGLTAVQSDEDARVAAAAVLSVCPEGGRAVGLKAFSADAVRVEKTDKGRACTLQQQFVGGTVTFNGDGKLTSASRSSMVPLPPSAPPRPR